MAEYYFALTDINNAIDRLIRACPTTFYNGFQAARNIFSKDLAADVQPVRHGRWETPNALAVALNVMVCSECGFAMEGGEKNKRLARYCPNCGAKMDEGE